MSVQNASEPTGFAAFLGVREEFFRPVFIVVNLLTALNRFCEQCSLEDLENVSKFATAQQHVIIHIFPCFDWFLLQGRR